MSDLSQIQIEAGAILKYKNLIATVIIVVAGLFFLRQAYVEYQVNLSQIEDKIQQLEETEGKVFVWREANRKYRISMREFFEDDPLDFQRYVEDGARRAGVGINSLRVSREKESFYYVGTIELRLDAYYRELLNFISRLEERHVFVDSIALRSGRDESMDISLTLKTVLVPR